MKVINLDLKLKRASVLLLIFVALPLTANIATAQEGPTEATPAIRLRSQAIVRGLIGGESHDSYVLHIRKSQELTVQISWRREGDNRAEFQLNRQMSLAGNRSISAKPLRTARGGGAKCR